MSNNNQRISMEESEESVRIILEEAAVVQEDLPLTSDFYNNDSPSTELKNIERDLELDNLINDKEKRKEQREDKKYYTAFRLIVGCLLMLGAVYLVDVIFNGIFDRESSKMTSNIMEILKTMLFTLSGFLFGKKSNNDS